MIEPAESRVDLPASSEGWEDISPTTIREAALIFRKALMIGRIRRAAEEDPEAREWLAARGLERRTDAKP